MVDLHDRLQLRPLSLRQARGSRVLLVWGDAGQWLVVDAEAAQLLEQFEKPSQVDDALRMYAQESGKPFDVIVAESLGVVNALEQRGLLGLEPFEEASMPEVLRISSLTFNITNRCNLKCPWCYNTEGAGGGVSISDLAKWLADGADCVGDDTAFFILGGEPFLDRRRLAECASGVRQSLQGEILVSTNGTHDPQEITGELAAARVTVQVSLDGASAESHDRIRGRGVFDQAIKTARCLIANNIQTVFSMVLRPACVAELEEYFDLALDVGVGEVRFIPLRRLGSGSDHEDDAPDLSAILKSLVEILNRRPELAQSLGRDFFSILMTVCRFSRLRDNCGIGRRCLFINADGSLFPCPNHVAQQWRCGHVSDTPLAKVLSHSTVLQSMREQYCVQRMPECSECGFRFWCAGDCRAEALCVTGSSMAASPYCSDLQAIIPELFWLIADGWRGLGNRPQQVRPWS